MMQENVGLSNFNEAFIQQIVVAPELWKMVSQVEFSFVASPSEMGLDNLSSYSFHVRAEHVEVAVGLVIGSSFDGVPVDE